MDSIKGKFQALIAMASELDADSRQKFLVAVCEFDNCWRTHVAEVLGKQSSLLSEAAQHCEENHLCVECD